MGVVEKSSNTKKIDRMPQAIETILLILPPFKNVLNKITANRRNMQIDIPLIDFLANSKHKSKAKKTIAFATKKEFLRNGKV